MNQIELSISLLSILTSYRTESIDLRMKELKWISQLIEKTSVQKKCQDSQWIFLPIDNKAITLILELPVLQTNPTLWTSNPYLLIRDREEIGGRKFRGLAVSHYRTFLSCYLARILLNQKVPFSLVCLIEKPLSHYQLLSSCPLSSSLIFYYPTQSVSKIPESFLEDKKVSYQKREYWRQILPSYLGYEIKFWGWGEIEKKDYDESISIDDITEILYFLEHSSLPKRLP